jgi:hypothetical protein
VVVVLVLLVLAVPCTPPRVSCRRLACEHHHGNARRTRYRARSTCVGSLPSHIAHCKRSHTRMPGPPCPAVTRRAAPQRGPRSHAPSLTRSHALSRSHALTLFRRSRSRRSSTASSPSAARADEGRPPFCPAIPRPL